MPNFRKPLSKLIKLQLEDKSPRYNGAGHLHIKQCTNSLSAGQKVPRDRALVEEPEMFTV